MAGIWASCWLLRCHLYPQVDEMDQRLRDAGFKFAFSPIRVKFRPTAKVREATVTPRRTELAPPTPYLMRPVLLRLLLIETGRTRRSPLTRAAVRIHTLTGPAAV